MKPRTLLAGTAVAVAALGTPANAGCCDHQLDIYVAKGAASVSTGGASEAPYGHTYDTTCNYSTGAPVASNHTAETGLLGVGVNAYSDLTHGTWDIRVHASCTLYTTTGGVYPVAASGSRLGFVQAHAANTVRVPGGLPVLKICVSANADWKSTTTYGTDSVGTLDEVCTFPGIHFKDADQDISVGHPL
ncbi:MAG TPA: hypothetical protein VFQ85_11915 [Mycobacteriales bacterium]|jgi:hypothetical protein|nr:hypothetical protein [Mycobacteriales bacterium]